VFFFHFASLCWLGDWLIEVNWGQNPINLIKLIGF